MAAIESPEKVGLKPFHEFDEANDDLAARRPPGRDPRGRGRVPRPVRDSREPRSRHSHGRHRLRRLPAQVRLRRRGAGAPTPTSTSSTGSRSSSSRTSRASCARSPTSRPCPRARPRRRSTSSRSSKLGEFLSYKVLRDDLEHGPDEALAKTGLRPEDVDFVSFDHLHVQDLRFVLGTTEPIQGEAAPRPPLFPNAKLITQRKEWDTFALAAPDAVGLVRRGRDQGRSPRTTWSCSTATSSWARAWRWSGRRATPTATTRSASTPTTASGSRSENGVCADYWHPHLSKIPGVRKTAEFFGREVILNSNTLEDSIDQYDSMIKEKALADPNRRDPRFLNVFPSSEMADWRRQWPVVPTFATAASAPGRSQRPGHLVQRASGALRRDAAPADASALLPSGADLDRRSTQRAHRLRARAGGARGAAADSASP